MSELSFSVPVQVSKSNKFKKEERNFNIIKIRNPDIRTKLKLISEIYMIENSFLLEVVSRHIVKSCKIMTDYCKGIKIPTLKKTSPILKSIIIELRSVCVYDRLVQLFDQVKKMDFPDEYNMNHQLMLLDKFSDSFNVEFEFEEKLFLKSYKKLVDNEWWDSKQDMLLGVLRHARANVNVEKVVDLVQSVYNTNRKNRIEE